MIIDCKSVILRAIELSDMDFLLAMMNDPAINRMISGDSFPISKDRQIRWFENYDQQKELRCIIQIKGGAAIGTIKLTNIDWKNRKAESGIKTMAKLEDRRPKDILDARMGFFNYCFNELNLNCIYGTVLEYNHLSRKMGKQTGAVVEGVLRQRVFKNGKYHNLLSVSTLAEDFNPIYKKYLEERLNDGA